MKYASSNHAVANDNGDEGTSGGSDHGDDGPGADNADDTNAEAQAAPERTTAALAEESPDMHEQPCSRSRKNRSSRSKQHKGCFFK